MQTTHFSSLNLNYGSIQRLKSNQRQTALRLNRWTARIERARSRAKSSWVRSWASSAEPVSRSGLDGSATSSTRAVTGLGGSQHTSWVPRRGGHATGASASGAVAAAERLRQAVERANIELFDGSRLRITVSAGVATGRMADTPDALIVLADEALYASKRAGRNRVTLAAPPKDVERDRHHAPEPVDGHVEGCQRGRVCRKEIDEAEAAVAHQRLEAGEVPEPPAPFYVRPADAAECALREGSRRQTQLRGIRVDREVQRRAAAQDRRAPSALENNGVHGRLLREGRKNGQGTSIAVLRNRL